MRGVTASIATLFILAACGRAPSDHEVIKQVKGAADAQDVLQLPEDQEGGARGNRTLELSANAMNSARGCYIDGTEAECANFEAHRTQMQNIGVPFCRLEVTRYVTESVPCGQEDEYLSIFTGGLIE